MKNGLTTRNIAVIRSIFRKYPEVTLVYIFGSRANGKHKPGSDVDLAVMNDGVTSDSISRIKEELEESSLPYFIDLVNYPTLVHKEFKEHIDRVGVEFYKKEDAF